MKKSPTGPHAEFYEAFLMKNEKMRNDERVFFLDPAKRSSTTLSEKPRKRKRLLRDSKRLAVSLPLEVVDVIPPSERSAESVWVEKVAERHSTALTIAGTRADLFKLGKQK